MIIIYEPSDMLQRAQNKPVEELTLNDLDPRVLTSPTIFVANQGIARRIVNNQQALQPRFEIEIAELMPPCETTCADCDKPLDLDSKGKCQNSVRDAGGSLVWCKHQCTEPQERRRLVLSKHRDNA